MRQVEEEIRSVRRKLGIMDDYKSTNDGAQQAESTTAEDVQSELPLPILSLSPASSKVSPAKKASSLLSTSPSAAGLPTEPRSRVLKLG